MTAETVVNGGWRILVEGSVDRRGRYMSAPGTGQLMERRNRFRVFILALVALGGSGWAADWANSGHLSPVPQALAKAGLVGPQPSGNGEVAGG